MSPDVMLTILKIAAVFIAVSFVVFWVGLVWWVSQDILTRTKDKIIVSAAVAITAILGPVGILIYLVVRPRQTLKERIGELMEREMMLQASAITICPTCERVAQDDFLACPHCGTALKKACLECGKLLAMDWEHCPFCGATQQPATVEVAEVIVEQIGEEAPAAKPSPESPPAADSRSSVATPVLNVIRGIFTPISHSMTANVPFEPLRPAPSTESESSDDALKAPDNHTPSATKKAKPRKLPTKKGRSGAKKKH